MDTEEVLLQAIHDQPGDEVAWQALADWLEEKGDARAELLRLDLSLRRGPSPQARPGLEQRLRELLVSGTRPCVPTLTNSLGMRFVLVPAGTFLMGSLPDEDRSGPDETQHEVVIERPFYLGAYLVTQAQWLDVMGSNPSAFKGPERPVENVTWEMCQSFCRKLGKRDKRRYRLPGEAEWEHACRAGTTSTFFSGDDPQSLRPFCWCRLGEGRHRSPRGTRAVGSLAPNTWGLFDMHGNVKEWCEDLLLPYPSRPGKRRRPRSTNDTRILRGGSWTTAPDVCRSACRDGWAPNLCDNNIGCRVVLCRD